LVKALFGLVINLVLAVALIIPAYHRARERYAELNPRQSDAGTLGKPSRAVKAAVTSLADARRGFTTRIVTTGESEPPAPAPPGAVFKLIRYNSPVGKLAAYVTPDPGDGAKHPAILWIAGGDCNSIGEMWTAMPRSNDQTAAAYRKTGIVTMFPSLRGGNDNPGRREGFYGEVDDVMAAADYLASLPYVDPERIYLGGHSTGGTLAMLVAETCTKFRAVFAFGPVADVRAYGGRFVYHDASDPKESELRAPGRWLDSVKTTLFVIEGSGGNIDSLKALQASNRNPMIRFVTVGKKDHFSILAPANELIASRILADTGANAGITLTDADADAIGSR
jgi:acetyl esterase/lipase